MVVDHVVVDLDQRSGATLCFSMHSRLTLKDCNFYKKSAQSSVNTDDATSQSKSKAKAHKILMYVLHSKLAHSHIKKSHFSQTPFELKYQLKTFHNLLFWFQITIFNCDPDFIVLILKISIFFSQSQIKYFNYLEQGQIIFSFHFEM